jgi:hypothetical protein
MHLIWLPETDLAEGKEPRPDPDYGVHLECAGQLPRGDILHYRDGEVTSLLAIGVQTTDDPRERNGHIRPADLCDVMQGIEEDH